MRPARRRSHNSHAHGRTGTRARVLGGATLALVLAGIVSVTLASHATTTWNFSIPSDYAYDQTKIIVESGVAHLRKSFTVTHSVQADFDIVAADINNGGGGKNLYWYKNSGGASPTFTKLAVTTSSTTPAPPVGPGVLAGCGIVGQSGTTLTARHDFADLDNNLTIDIVEPGQTSTTLGLMQYLNPG